MKLTAYNPQKGRLETLDVEITKENTTWFEKSRTAQSVARITDFDGGLLIQTLSYDYPVWLYDISRADIGYSHKKAKQLIKLHK
jgi:hypothetical protein